MHLAKGWNSLGKELINFVWIFIHCSSTVLLDRKLQRTPDGNGFGNVQLPTTHWGTLAEYRTFHKENSWALGSNLLFCGWASQGSKDPKKVPSSINYKGVYMLLGTKDKAVTNVTLEFLNNLILLFEQFVLLFKKSSQVVHLLYDSMYDILAKCMRRFMKTQVLEKNYGSDLASIECKDLKLKLIDKDVVIGDSTRKALKELSLDNKEMPCL